MENYSSLCLDNQLCFPLYACAKEVIRRYRKSLEPLKLTYTQYIVMMVLWEHGTVTESELGKKWHLDSGTLAPLLKRLDKIGYITRERLDNNERKLFLSLTEAGEELKDKALGIPFSIQDCIGLTSEEVTLLKQLLDKAMTHMMSRE